MELGELLDHARAEAGRQVDPGDDAQAAAVHSWAMMAEKLEEARGLFEERLEKARTELGIRERALEARETLVAERERAVSEREAALDELDP